jgi:hypothetical protein
MENSHSFLGIFYPEKLFKSVSHKTKSNNKYLLFRFSRERWKITDRFWGDLEGIFLIDHLSMFRLKLLKL